MTIVDDFATVHLNNYNINGLSPPRKASAAKLQVRDLGQSGQILGMHRNNVGDRGHKEGALRHGASLILKIIGKAVRVPQPHRHDRTAEGTLRCQSRPPAQGRARRQKLTAV